MKEFFRWIGRTTVARTKSGNSPGRLVYGEVYSKEGFDPKVIAEWIKTGVAEDYKNPKPSDTRLNVQSGKVSAKSLNVGEKKN